MAFELTAALLSELREAIQNSNEQLLAERLGELYPQDIAEVIEQLKEEEAKYLLSLLEEEKAADTIVELEEDVREKFLESLTPKEIAEHIDKVDSDDAADMISQLPDEQQDEVLAHLEDTEQASDIVDLLNYDEDSAGGIMAKELVAVNQSWTVSECVTEIRKQGEDLDDIYAVYVIDDQEKLLGTVSLTKLLIAPASTRIEDIYDDDVISVKADEDAEEIAKMMDKYDLVVLPVVDSAGRLTGRITIDDAMDVMREEADKDIQIMSGISEDVEVSDNVFLLTRARLPWLLIGMLGGILGAEIIGIFNLEENMEMAFFIPLIAAMAGNVGIQSSAIIVQALANKSIEAKNIMGRLGKEFGVALLNGIICAIIILGAGLVLGYSPRLSITVSIALLTVIIFAALFGTFVPLILHRWKIDPALATGPFVTTTNDILGLFVYFFVGQIMYSM